MQILITLFLSVVLLTSCGTGRDDDVHGAWAYTQLFVEQELKSPKSADFPFGGAEAGVTPLGSGRYAVESYVDTSNGYGAIIRINFKGVIVKSEKGDQWTLESLDFYE